VLWRAREALAGAGIRRTRQVARRLREIPDGEALPEPFVTGLDLLRMGLPEGPLLGRVLREVYDAQLSLQVRSRRQALARARSRIEQLT